MVGGLGRRGGGHLQRNRGPKQQPMVEGGWPSGGSFLCSSNILSLPICTSIYPSANGIINIIVSPSKGN